VNKPRVHFLTKYRRAGASSRYRTFQYLPAVEAAGFECVVSPLFDDDYLSHKYAYGRAKLRHVIVAFMRRFHAVLTMPRGAVVVVEYELLPFFPAVLERLLVWRNCRLLMDYDDALFHQYDQHAKPWIRRFLGNKIATVMRLADTVVAGNAYLASYAQRAGARRVDVVPTVVDLARYSNKARESGSAVFTIGWIGSPSTARYLHDIAPALAAICQGGQTRVRLIGSGPIDLPGVALEVLPWREDTEVNQMCRFDVGIMPLPDEPWARGKCGFKLIQYMACGLPVVASPVGVNAEIVDDGVNGFLASTTAEWVNALETLRADFQLQQRMGRNGSKRVEERYCLEVTTQQLVALLQSVSKGHGLHD
jgi:glycosyltransferase involved in cell wall biosynthesis